MSRTSLIEASHASACSCVRRPLLTVVWMFVASRWMR